MEKKLLVVCEAGISAALLVSKMLEVIRREKLDYVIDYTPVSRLAHKLSLESFDVLLLTPQVSRYQEEIQASLAGIEATRIDFIQPDDFRYMNAEKILHQV